MKIEAFFDTSCSWCRVGKVNLHRAIDKLVKEGKIKEEDIEIVYRSYVIYPEVPVEGADYKAIQIANDDTDDWDPAKNTPIHRWAKRAGLNFNFDRITVKPNTWRAHQFLHIVRDEKPEVFEDLVNDIQQAYFEDGIDIGNQDVICALAKKYVDNVYEINERVKQGEKLDAVKYDTEEIGDNKYDINIVPLFVFDEKVKLDGAVLQSKFEDAILGKLDK